jgi:transformation/transcription domain-associated protein
LESALKTNNFGKIKSLLREKSPNITTLKLDDTRAMAEICLAINRGKLAEADDLITHAVQSSLRKSISLPQIRAGVVGPHENLYQEFQRLVELRESCQMIMESTTSSKQRGLPDLKNILSTWRRRNPNLFDPVSVWEYIYAWRLHIFDSIAKLFAWNDPAIVSTLHDRPYASIVFGRAARKQNLKEISIVLLRELTESMILPDAFLKMREQIVAYQYSTDVDILKGGLNLVLSTNLTYFDPQQKAEMLRLKSYFYSVLNDKSNAHKSYSQTLQTSPNYGRGEALIF